MKIILHKSKLIKNNLKVGRNNIKEAIKYLREEKLNQNQIKYEHVKGKEKLEKKIVM